MQTRRGTAGCADSRVERKHVALPLDRRRIGAVQQDCVETAGGFPWQAREVRARRERPARLLRRRDACGGAAECGGRTPADFDEHERRAVVGDEVDLAVACAKVAGDDREAVRGEERRRERFGVRADGGAISAARRRAG